MSFLRLVIFSWITLHFLCAQTQPVYGLRDKTPDTTAIINAHIVTKPGTSYTDGIIIVRNGLIENIGKNISIPKDAVVVNAQGSFVYPGFIESYSSYGLPKSNNKDFHNNSGSHWNEAVCAERCASDYFTIHDKDAEELRKQGFTAVQTAFFDGIFRGQSSVVLLSNADSNKNVSLKTNYAQFASFTKGSSSTNYPNSLMGSIALTRQVLYDTIWYQKAMEAYQLNPHQSLPELNHSLASLAPVVHKQQTLIFDVSDELSLLRAGNIAKEFSLKFVYKGSGDEYKRVEAIEKLKSTLIIPINFPDVPDVSTPEKQFDVSLGKLKHWNTAPENPRRLYEAGINFAFTMEGTDKANFLTNLRKAVSYGLPKDIALAALTSIPAEICGVSSVVGTLEKGKIANFIVSSEDLFSSDSKIYSVWVSGEKYEVNPLPEWDFRGKWEVRFAENAYDLTIQGTTTPTCELKQGEDKVDASIQIDENKINLTIQSKSGVMRLWGRMVADKISGIAILTDENEVLWQAQKTAKHEEKKQVQQQQENPRALFEISYPNIAFGTKTEPEQPYVVFIDNATIWTSGPEGVIEEGDIIIRQGKIEKIGKDLIAPPGIVIDGKGLHITPGIIDEHSHIAISRGVNEGTEAVTAEVRIGDVVNSNDIDIYRQLAGGVTSSHLLHGSANPIGGQLQLIKLRWGKLPEELKFKNVPKTIKFALGENVKQSNWGDNYRTRYPQSRMGVREIFYDTFQGAKEYQEAHQKYNSLSLEEKQKTIPPRKDLELDAIVDILNQQMFIHCHSYVQSEILALARLANEFGFHVGTFTHVLEGYKVAREIKESGAMASCFSDWWAYKFEVYDAIPYNAALMHRQGVIVSMNSDDAEMARRLNQEAAKAIKYGGLSEEEALKLVTINPAKQLYVEKHVGSLEPGKDADFVIWNDNPLSCYARVLQTWVDGRKYFDMETDRLLREEVKKEKAALIQLALKKKDSGAKVDDAPVKKNGHYHCDDVYEAVRGEN